MTLKPQQKLNTFTLLEKIGSGGDGEVWKASDKTGQLIALKAKLNSDDPSRFQEEFERLRVLRFPNVVQAHQTGIAEGHIYYTMQLAVGLHYHEYVQGGEGLSEKIARCITATKGIATALSALHQAGIAHLDLKPDNIIVSEDGFPLLVDFGRSCALGDRRLNEGMQATMQYMAPEQRVGLPTSTEADIYSLGVSIYEAVTGQSAPRHLIGQPWPSLIFLGPEIRLSFAELVSDMLSLDQMRRPSAEKVLGILTSIEHDLPLPPPKYPEPAQYIGDASVLQRRSAVVVGPYGSGCTRMINEARREWFISGCRSISGQCHPSKPYGAMVEVLEALFQPYSPAMRRTIAGDQSALLRVIAPNLPLPSTTTEDWPVDTERLAVAIAQVLDRVKPIALVFYEAHLADTGTASLLSILVDNLPEGIYIWCSSRIQLPWGQHVSPPVWGSYQDKAVFHDLLSDIMTDASESTAKTPLESCFRIWCQIAKWRGDHSPDHRSAAQLANLSLLSQPFPKSVGHNLNAKINEFVASNDLQVVRKIDGDAYLQFRTQPDYLMARATVSTLRINLLAAQAWQRSRYLNTKNQEAAFHRLIIGNDSRPNIHASIRIALEQDDSLSVQRWLRLYDLCHDPTDNDFVLAYARAYIALHIRPGRLASKDFSTLSRMARSKAEAQLVDYLGLQQMSKHGSSMHAIEMGRSLLERTKQDDPRLAATIYYKLSGTYIRNWALETSLEFIKEGLKYLEDSDLIDEDSLANPLRIQYSAALIYSLKLPNAEEVCLKCRNTALIHDLTSDILSASVNLCLVYYQQGKRQEARQIIMSSKRYLLHADLPIFQAYFSLIDGVLAIDRGDYSLGVSLLDRAISVAQPIELSYVLRNAYTALLFAAIATASREDARRAMNGYSSLTDDRPQDLWPVALAQWKWFNGDLKGARSSLKQNREAYEDLRIKLEQAKFELIAGECEKAAEISNLCLEKAQSSGCNDIYQMAKLIYVTATGKNNQKASPILAKLKESEWLDHYLGGPYINAIRLRLRGEDITPALDVLHERSTAVNHSLYIVLSDPESW